MPFSALSKPHQDMLAKVRERYEIGALIGEGGQAVVYQGKRKADNRNVALKIPRKMEGLNRNCCLDKEIEMLAHIKSACVGYEDDISVVQCIDTIATDVEKTLVLELIEGPDLFDDMFSKGATRPYSEYLVSQSIFAVARILSGLQKHKVVHRDIKPENLVYTSWDRTNRQLKLIDFGMACFTSDAAAMDKAGTLAYQAPEILQENGTASTSSDVWALGVMLFTMLSGMQPFVSPDGAVATTTYNILSGTFSFDERYWSHVPNKEEDENTARHLLRQMLQVDPEKRITVAEIMLHPWMTKNQQTKPFESEVLQRLRVTRVFEKYGWALRIVVFLKRWVIRIRAKRRKVKGADAAVFSETDSVAVLAVAEASPLLDNKSSNKRRRLE